MQVYYNCANENSPVASENYRSTKIAIILCRLKELYLLFGNEWHNFKIWGGKGAVGWNIILEMVVQLVILINVTKD